MPSINFNNLAGGLNTGMPRDQLPAGQVPVMRNMTVIDGVLRTRAGYTQDANFTGHGNMLAGRWYKDGFSSKSYFWACTDSKIVHKSGNAPGTGTWTDATNSMVIKSGADQYYSIAEVVDYTSFKNNIILCQNHSNMLTALNGSDAATSSVILFADAPDSTTLAKLTGALGYNHATGGDDYHRAKGVVGFAGRLFIWNTYERVSASAWAALPYRLRYSENYLFKAANDWNDQLTGSTAGRWDAREEMGPILNCVPLRTTLVIYLANGIASALKTNSITQPIDFSVRMNDLGLYAPRMVVSARNQHFFVGSDSEIYRYWGGSDPEPIGANVRTAFFNAINKGTSGGYRYADRGLALHLFDRHAVAFVIPTTTNYPDTAWIYYYQENRWEQWVPVDEIIGAGIWERTAASANTMITGDMSGKLFYWDNDTVLSDAGSAIDSYIETPDLIPAIKNVNNVTKLWFEAESMSGTATLTLSTSTDGGVTFGQSQAITIAAGKNAYCYQFTATGYQMRFRFRCNTADKGVKLGRIWTDFSTQGEVIT